MPVESSSVLHPLPRRTSPGFSPLCADQAFEKNQRSPVKGWRYRRVIFSLFERPGPWTPHKAFPAFISRCSRIGPRLRAGKNVRAPTIRMVETSKPANKPPVTGNVPADAGTFFFFARLPAMASTGMIMKNRPRSCAVAVVVLYHIVFTFNPAKAEPLLPVEET